VFLCGPLDILAAMTTRERRVVFGEVADDYDRVRPGYPAQLVEDVLAAAGPGPVLEVGAGTGKATAAFAARVGYLTCVEPDPRMAGVLRRKLPDVRIIASSFEDWTPDRGYGLLYSGQAWHWVDNERRSALAFAALAPGGLLAPFWNTSMVADPPLHAVLQEVDGRHGLTDHTPHRPLARDLPQPDLAEDRAELRLDEEHFPEMTIRRYHYTRTIAAADYPTFLRSFSIYRMLEPAAADAVIADSVEAIEAHGGVIDFAMVTDLVLARRTA
jgi:trans-aconitate methyltransferase